MNHEEHDELWDLLGKARQPSVSPFFSRNVLRGIREAKQERPGFFSWLRGRWQVAALATCAAVAAGTAMVTIPDRQPPDEAQMLALAERVSDSPDYQVINHLDELLDSEENSVWLDNNVY